MYFEYWLYHVKNIMIPDREKLNSLNNVRNIQFKTELVENFTKAGIIFWKEIYDFN